MEKIKSIFIYISIFIVGYLIFSIIFSIIQMVAFITLDLYGNLMQGLLTFFNKGIIIYTILFFSIWLINLIYNINLTKKLNQKIKEINKK